MDVPLPSELSEHFGHWKEMYEINMILKGFKINWPLWTTQTMKWDARIQHDFKRFSYLLHYLSTLVIEKKLMKSIRS